MLTKKEVREKVRAQREALDRETVAQRSAAIVAKILALPAYKEAASVMVYLAFRGEVETRDLIRDALAAGKRVAAPVTLLAEKRLVPRELRRYPEDLSPGAWGILEPSSSCPPVDPKEIDLVIVPGVAFDRRGNRLGYGGGFYDRFLKALREDAVTVAPAYSFQVFEELPVEESDVPVAYLVTEEEVIFCKELRG